MDGFIRPSDRRHSIASVFSTWTVDSMVVCSFYPRGAMGGGAVGYSFPLGHLYADYSATADPRLVRAGAALLCGGIESGRAAVDTAAG